MLNYLNNFYVYAHFRADTHKVFYIGKGSKTRASQTSKRNKYWKRVVIRHGFYFKILKIFDNELLAFDYEYKLISRCKRFGIKLTNLSDGGKGGMRGLLIRKNLD